MEMKIWHPLDPPLTASPKLLIQEFSNKGANQWRIQDFPEEGVPTLQEGTPTNDFAKFSQKMHEIKRIGTPGARVPHAPLDPQMLGNCKEGATYYVAIYRKTV